MNKTLKNGLGISLVLVGALAVITCSFSVKCVRT